MGYPRPQGRPAWALSPTNGPPDQEADAPTPNPVLIARILLWCQGAVSAVAVLLGVAGLALVLIFYVDSPLGGSAPPADFYDALAAIGVAILILVVGVAALAIGTVAFGVMVPSLILAARFGRRTNGVRVGTLVLEGIVCGLSLFASVSAAIDRATVPALALLPLAALSGAVFGLLLTPQAKDHFRL
ncbi:hypothetical protein [Nocardiopsis chromatogenes]|uniref:hypothetical protein n=1 Tax=Nocardiopsis chromatogenes TaxID=280239 RepID=UPI000345D792|nr:hypothetical protein [Nocardiopsis chromatogenes]